MQMRAQLFPDSARSKTTKPWRNNEVLITAARWLWLRGRLPLALGGVNGGRRVVRRGFWLQWIWPEAIGCIQFVGDESEGQQYEKGREYRCPRVLFFPCVLACVFTHLLSVRATPCPSVLSKLVTTISPLSLGPSLCEHLTRKQLVVKLTVVIVCPGVLHLFIFVCSPPPDGNSFYHL